MHHLISGIMAIGALVLHFTFGAAAYAAAVGGLPGALDLVAYSAGAFAVGAVGWVLICLRA